jgi:hypothetical protein
LSTTLESLISNFVDDVLRLLRDAKVEALLDLVAEAPRPIPPLEDSEPELPVDDAEAEDADERTADDDETDVFADEAEDEVEEAPVTHVTPIARGRRPRVAPTVEEITDPASLLAIAPESRVAPAMASGAPAPPPTMPTLLEDPTDEVEPPPSSSQESRVLVRLNSNETVARASNAGIVIRRKKA